VSYVVCRGCGAAKNPRSKLTFHDTEEFGWLCGNCYGMRKRQAPEPGPPVQDNLVVVVCPSCVGKGKSGAPKFERCSTCVGFGSVRVAANALAVFKPKLETEPAEPQVLTEG
jgi:hypothetical protein